MTAETGDLEHITKQKQKMQKQKDHQIHIPVLLDEVLQYLKPAKGQNYLDLTAGYGGHASEVLARTLNGQDSVLVDRDEQAVETLKKRFAKDEAVTILHEDFLTAAKHLNEQDRQFDMILADLGVSSAHLDNASRGFSLKDDAPLDMRMDNRQPLTAADIVNTYPEQAIAELLRQYGEEPKARKIASLIVSSRPITTTSQLAQIVTRAWPGHSKVHPATRTFQALRIAVNNELMQLEKVLPICLQLLKPGGRLVIISFHSLEDRIVKKFLSEFSGERYDSELTLLTKQPVSASKNELASNPRARSAKLRAAVKINTKERETNANSGKK